MDSWLRPRGAIDPSPRLRPSSHRSQDYPRGAGGLFKRLEVTSALADGVRKPTAVYWLSVQTYAATAAI
jgi:hypothetical protein